MFNVPVNNFQSCWDGTLQGNQPKDTYKKDILLLALPLKLIINGCILMNFVSPYFVLLSDIVLFSSRTPV